MSVKLLTEHHLEFLSLKGGCAGSSASTLFKMPYYWKSHVMADLSTQVQSRVWSCFIQVPLASLDASAWALLKTLAHML